MKVEKIHDSRNTKAEKIHEDRTRTLKRRKLKKREKKKAGKREEISNKIIPYFYFKKMKTNQK